MSWNNSAIENVKKIGVKSLNKTVRYIVTGKQIGRAHV